MNKHLLASRILTLILGLGLFFGLNAGAFEAPKIWNLDSVSVPLEECTVLLGPDTSVGTVKLGDEENIVIAEWNVANVMELRGAFTTDGVNPLTQKYVHKRDESRDRKMDGWKFPAKQKKISEVGYHLGLGREVLPHFIASPEVENAKAGNHLFNTGILQGKYKVFAIEGNDDRGIDVSLQVRADLHVKVEMQTHRHAMWFDPATQREVRLFSRDLPVMIVRDYDSNDVKLIFIGYHGKSKRDRKGDRESDRLATAQFFGAAAIIREYKKRFPGVPIVTAGDLNRDGRFEEEVAPLKAELTDAFDIVEPNTRITQTFHPNRGETVKSQLDAILVSNEVKPFVKKTMVIPEFDHITGEPLDFAPRSFDERNDRYPSDHRMTAIVINGSLFRLKPRSN